MSYQLHVTAGPSLDLSTHRPVLVNDEHPLEIETPYFRGRITVRVKEFPGHDSSTQNSPHSSRYFNDKTATFSLQCQGQYGDTSQPDSLTGDDIMFGIVLREPLSDTPPLGLNLIARTMRFFWPIMESDLRSPSPWVLSPMLATMSRVHFHAPVSADHERPLEKYPHEENTNAPKQSRPELPPWPGVMADAESENIISVLASSRLLQNSSSSLLPTRSRATSVSSSALSPPPPRPSLISRLSLSPRPRTLPDPFSSDPKSRKRHFSALTARKEVRINPTDTITTDFRNSFIDFRDLSLSVPGVPFKIELGKYMVGRPTQYVCRNREGKVFWAIVFTILRY